ncbi:MAG: hypothetical protein LQ339_004214 [Xanthoria mediterranea]|nr:MAG: hypothetical protein LQ339_004214 [Xanthoria mediterranea]
MKFITTITALAALLPILALAVATPAVPDDVIDLEGSAPTQIANSAAPNNTVAIEGVDYDDTPLNGNGDLAGRALTKQSDLTINIYRNKGCSGPRLDVRMLYDTGYQFPIRSYITSRKLKRGEVLNLYAPDKYKGKCGRVTSHTPQKMDKGCHALGGWREEEEEKGAV